MIAVVDLTDSDQRSISTRTWPRGFEEKNDQRAALPVIRLPSPTATATPVAMTG
jgi:hypothetical protein